MELELMKRLCEGLKPGAYANIVYIVDCPVKAEYKKHGIEIQKTVSMTARFKINYGNIKSVKERNSDKPKNEKSNKVNNFVPIVKNAIYHNNNTDKYYLSVFNTNNPCVKKLYQVNLPMFGEDNWSSYSEEEVLSSGMLLDSYVNKKSSEMFRINIDNISSINGRWK